VCECPKEINARAGFHAVRVKFEEKKGYLSYPTKGRGEEVDSRGRIEVSFVRDKGDLGVTLGAEG